MKKWLIGVMTVLMAVSLAACTPTTEKQKKETTAAAAAKSQEDMVPPSTGGASDKVPDPNVMPVAVISIYHGGGGSLVQDMDSLDTEGLDAQLLVDKLSYRFQNPKRFDIIVFPYQYEENTYYIKRIIGLPGETVQVVDGYVYINGSRLESDIYGNELMDDPMAASQPITLGEDEYFVLGDNRNHSQDSRDPSVGEVKKDTIMGKAWVRIYPFDKMGVIRHE